MNIKATLGIALIFSGVGAVFADSAIDELNMGLSKTSVFDAPTPSAFDYPKTKAGKSDLLPQAYATAPPQIPHKVDSYIPITADTNECLDCHDKPNLIGKEYTKGGKLPMSASHYGSFGDSGDTSKEVAGARYNCTQCHVPQSGAAPLVENTF